MNNEMNLVSDADRVSQRDCKEYRVQEKIDGEITKSYVIVAINIIDAYEQVFPNGFHWVNEYSSMTSNSLHLSVSGHWSCTINQVL